MIKLRYRITADIDKTPIYIVKKRIFYLNLCLNAFENINLYDFEIVKSSGGKGYHVICWSDKKINKNKIFYIRYLFGDDVKRIVLDKRRRRSRQFLFKTKKIIK